MSQSKTKWQRFVKWMFCDIVPWHNGHGSSTRFDGASMHGTCSRCGREVMLDSQGNWFTY